VTARRLRWPLALPTVPPTDAQRNPHFRQLWYAYLMERYEAVRGLCVTNPAYAALNNTFERALVTMHKMPKVWELYLNFLVEQRVITKVRRACDRALASLPVTQHERVWSVYLVRPRNLPEFASEIPVLPCPPKSPWNRITLIIFFGGGHWPHGRPPHPDPEVEARHQRTCPHALLTNVSRALAGFHPSAGHPGGYSAPRVPPVPQV